MEEVSEQTRVLGDVLDLSVEKSEYLPCCKACRGGRGAPLLQPPQTLGFHSKFLANTDHVKPALLAGFLGKTGLILWSIFASTHKEKFGEVGLREKVNWYVLTRGVVDGGVCSQRAAEQP